MKLTVNIIFETFLKAGNPQQGILTMCETSWRELESGTLNLGTISKLKLVIVDLMPFYKNAVEICILIVCVNNAILF